MPQKAVKPKKLITFIAILTTAIVAVTIVFAVLAINRAKQFDQTIEAECAPLVVLAFRGSGEKNLDASVTENSGKPFQYGDSQLVTNGWEGITLTHLFNKLSQTSFDGFDADQVPVLPIGPASDDEPYGYEAIAAILEAGSLDSALTFSSSSLLQSAMRGAEAATHVMHDYLKKSEGCPVAPEFVIVGYSQGAMAARHTAELNPELVRAVIKIGDPYQQPNGPGVRSDGASGVGIIRWKADDEQQKLLDTYYGSIGYTSSICHGDDPICKFSPVEGLLKLATGMYGDHMNYYNESHLDEAEEDSMVIAQIAKERWDEALAAQKAGQKVDWSKTETSESIVRVPSMIIAGTPTLVSAFNLAHLGGNFVYEFDLDGDGVFETTSTDGFVWVTFDEDGPKTISARIINEETGETQELHGTAGIMPEGEGEIPLTPETVPAEAPKDDAPRQREPETVVAAPAQPSAQPVSNQQTPWIAPQPSPTPAPAPAVTPPAPKPAPTTPAAKPDPAPPAPAPKPDPKPEPPAPKPEPPVPDPEPEPTPPVPDPEPEPPSPDPEPDPEPPAPEPEPDPAPAIQADGTEWSPGGIFEITGSGFPPDTPLFMDAFGSPAEAFTDENGDFTAEVVLPDDIDSGTHNVNVVNMDNDEESWEFEITLEEHRADP